MKDKNNGWIKVEHKKDLPNLNVEYHVIRNEQLTTAYYVGSDRWICPGNSYPKTTKIHGISHYQEIVIPELPKY